MGCETSLHTKSLKKPASKNFQENREENASALHLKNTHPEKNKKALFLITTFPW
jgi:hypothetical protein